MYINRVYKYSSLLITFIVILIIYKLYFNISTQELFENALRLDKNLMNREQSIIEIRNIEKQIYSKGTEPIEFLVSMLNSSEVTIRNNYFERLKYSYNQFYKFIHDIIYNTETKTFNYVSAQCATFILGNQLIAYEILDHIDTDEVVTYIRNKMDLFYDESSKKYLIRLLSKSNKIIDIEKLICYININESNNISECAHKLLKNKLLSLGIVHIPGDEMYNIKLCQDPFCLRQNNITCILPHRIPNDSLEISIIQTNKWWLCNRNTVEILLNNFSNNYSHN